MINKKQLLTQTICQLGFPYRQLTLQPATALSWFDRKATRNPQLHIVPYVICQFKKRAANIFQSLFDIVLH